jgi:hypothetical protein
MWLWKTRLDTQRNKLGLKKQSKFLTPGLGRICILVGMTRLLLSLIICFIIWALVKVGRGTQRSTRLWVRKVSLALVFINISDKIVTLPQESINLEGILLQRFKEVEGSSESTLKISVYPVIFRPVKTIDLLQEHKTFQPKSSKAKKYIFRQVNFTAKELTSLFVLQNMESDITLVFEDCHFLNER